MIANLVLSLVLTLIIELIVSLLIGVRKRNDIITIIAVNTLTNPIAVFIATLTQMNGNIIVYWIVVAIIELIVFLVEGAIFKKILIFDKISGIKLSLINNLTSFSIGLLITIVMTSTSIKIEAASAFYLKAKANIDSQKLNCSVEMKSTTEVYEDLINGNADIIIVSQPSDEQKEIIEKSNRELEFVKIYLEPLAILVNKDNPIDDISVEEIKEIYYTNNTDYNTYQLEKNNGSQTCFETIVSNNKLENNHYEIKTMPGIIDKVGEDNKGIGYAFNSYFPEMYDNSNVKAIKVNGFDLNDENYPLLYDVYLIYDKDNNKRIDDIIKKLNYNKKAVGFIRQPLWT